MQPIAINDIPIYEAVQDMDFAVQRTKSWYMDFKTTLNNANYSKLMKDVELFEATRKTVVAELSRTAGVSERFVEVQFSKGSVKVDARIEIPPQLEKTSAEIGAELKSFAARGELLQSLIENPRFNELKEDP